MEEAEAVSFHKKFKLESSLNTSNMVSAQLVGLHIVQYTQTDSLMGGDS